MEDITNIKNIKNITNIVIECPHCKDPIIIEKLNCCIFRHGILKINNKQIEPHANKDLCDFYIKNNLIFGCGMPFQIILNENSKNNDDKFIAKICDYI
jgi:hypothetical protein